jgi:hypothetical protein
MQYLVNQTSIQQAKKNVPQGPEPVHFAGICGTTEVVP